MDVPILLAAISVAVLLAMAPIVWFAAREIGRTRDLFRELALRLGGTTTRLPYGLVFEREGRRVRPFALQGAIHFRAAVPLRSDPGILVARKFRRLAFLDALHYSPSRTRFVVHSSVDRLYVLRVKDPRRMHKIFDEGLREHMRPGGRITRIAIDRHGLRGTFMVTRHTDAEHALVLQSVEILNLLPGRIVRSGLALPRSLYDRRASGG